MTQRPRDEFPVEACWLSQIQEGQTEQIHPQTFDDPFFDSTGMISMHWVPTGLTVNKEYYVEVLKEFRKRFHRKRPILFKSGQWHFHQDNFNNAQAYRYPRMKPECLLSSRLGLKNTPTAPLQRGTTPPPQ